MGSGKSTFAQALVQNSQSSWRRVNQDTLKSRRQCVTVAQQSLAASCNVIVDRMNFDTDQRGHWVKLAADFQSPCYALCLNYPADICAKRGAQRTRHEGGVTGEKARQLSFTMSHVIAGALPCTPWWMWSNPPCQGDTLLALRPRYPEALVDLCCRKHASRC